MWPATTSGGGSSSVVDADRHRVTLGGVPEDDGAAAVAADRGSRRCSELAKRRQRSPSPRGAGRGRGGARRWRPTDRPTAATQSDAVAHEDVAQGAVDDVADRAGSAQPPARRHRQAPPAGDRRPRRSSTSRTRRARDPVPGMLAHVHVPLVERRRRRRPGRPSAGTTTSVARVVGVTTSNALAEARTTALGRARAHGRTTSPGACSSAASRPAQRPGRPPARPRSGQRRRAATNDPSGA